MKRKSTVLLILLALLVFISVSCKANPWDSYDDLVFDGLDAYTGKMGDISCECNFGDVMVVENGKYNGLTKSVTLTNSTNKIMYIDEIDFDNGQFNYSGGNLNDNPTNAFDFDFGNHESPAFPIVINAKSKIELPLGFYPRTRGYKECRMTFTVRSDGYQQGRLTSINLSGRGMVRLTLKLGLSYSGGVSSPADGNLINIINPITVNKVVEDGSMYFDTTSDSVTLEAKFISIQPLKFLKWRVETPSDSSLWYPEIADDSSIKTTVNLKGHTTIAADYFDPNVYLWEDNTGRTDTYTTLTDCVTAVKNSWTGKNPGDDGYKENIIIYSTNDTTHGSIGNNTIIESGISVYGGFLGNAPTVDDRRYITEADRNVKYIGSIIIPNYAKAKTKVEGLYLEAEVATSVQAAITINNSAESVISYCTFLGNQTLPGLYSYYSNADISNCVVKGGNNSIESNAMIIDNGKPTIAYCQIEGLKSVKSGDYSADSYGLKLLGDASPFVYKCTILGGTAEGDNGETSAVYFDDTDGDGRPILCGNIIKGGEALGSGGKTYGINLVNYVRLLATHNDIYCGNANSSSACIETRYGANLYANNNQLRINDGSASNKYGLYAGNIVKIRQMENNHFVIPNSGRWTYYYKLVGNSSYDSLDSANEEFDASLTTFINGDIDDTRNTSSENAIEISIPDLDNLPKWEL